MRILFSSSPFAGHLFPLLPLERAARESGHDIAVLTSEPLAPLLDPGTEVLPAGPMPDVLLAEVARRKGTDPTRDNAPDIVAELFAGTRVDLGFEPAVEAAERWRPDLIVFEQCDFIGPLVAAALGCKSAFLAYGRAYEPAYTTAMTTAVASRYRRYRLEPAEPLAFLDTCPPSLQVAKWTPPPGHRYLRPEPHRQLGGEWTAPDFTDRSDRPVVLVTLGTVFSATPMLSSVLSALGELDVNAIVTVGPLGDPSALEVDTTRVHVEPFVPLDLLLTGVSAVVSHGGGGTILAALSRGLPLVLLPQGADQFHNAQRIAEVQAGISLIPSQATPGAIRASVERAMTDPELRAGAAGVAAEIAAMDPPEVVIADLAQRVQAGVAMAA
jgi:UDP:flavonoid glycosyltransferase YjiC (YdhE family)